MATDELYDLLKQVSTHFHLGEYEIEAYLTVLDHGQLTASEIAKHSSIPQPRVYDTVRSLNDRGLVELRESRPMKVIAVDPVEAFDNVRSSMEEMVTKLETRFTTPGRDTEAVSLIKSRSTILRNLAEIIESAKFELSLSLTVELLHRFEESLSKARQRGVSIELIVTPSNTAPDPGSYDYVRIASAVRARRGITTPVVAVADGEYSIYATQDALRDDRDRYGVIFNRSALGFLVSRFFGTILWTTADPLAFDEQEKTFPRQYATIRRCIKDIKDRQGEFFATIEGRDVETGNTRIVRGLISETSIVDTEEVASITIETEEGPISVGGRVAALETVEAHRIHVTRNDSPP